MRPKSYHVERQTPDGQWMTVFGSKDTSRLYCLGWIHGIDSIYPSAPYRVIATYANGAIDVVEETRGRSSPHTN